MFLTVQSLKDSLGVTLTGTAIDEIYLGHLQKAHAILENYLKTTILQANYSDRFFVIQRFQRKQINLMFGLRGLINISNLQVFSGPDRDNITTPIDLFYLDIDNGVVSVYGTAHDKFYKMEYRAGIAVDANGIYLGNNNQPYIAAITALVKGRDKNCKKKDSGCQEDILKKFLPVRDLYNTRKAL